MKNAFVIRKIKNGAVRIFGKTFRPEERFAKYDGRLDGMEFAFGRYDPVAWEGRPEFVALWGTAASYRGEVEDFGKSAECFDGGFPWYWWRADT